MIAARELRIGNCISRFDLGDSSERFEQILELGTKVTTTGGLKVLCDYKDIFPIPLSEEMLLKCGFEKVENNWKCLDINFGTISWERLAGLTLTLEYESVYLPHIKHLHQLQNLYFALTGEELEVNL